jgi:hypothetical protein
MLLQARLLNNVTTVNDYDVSTQVAFTQGDSVQLYLVLVDALKDQKLNPPGRRFIPAAGATLTLTIQNENSVNTVTKVCTQPFPQDPSIWTFQILPADGLSGMYSFALTLNQSSVLTYARVFNGLQVWPQSGIATANPGYPPSFPTF